MNIEKDFGYIGSGKSKLIQNGYVKMTVHSIHFSRYYRENEKPENANDKPLREIISTFIEKYNIHQATKETSTMEHYRSDWDLFFWSNRGWNGNNYMDCFSLTFNDRRTPEQNMNLLDEIISILENMEYKNVSCRIQYDAVIDENKVAEAALKVFENLAGKFIEYSGMTGKIKVVSEENENKEYGFFKKGAKSRYYRISNEEMLLMSL